MDKRDDDDDATDTFSDPVSPLAKQAGAEDASKLSHEAWAERKGMLPQFAAGNPSSVSTGERPNPEYWKWAATKAFMGWQDRQEMTEAEFDAAVAKQMEQVTR